MDRLTCKRRSLRTRGFVAGARDSRERHRRLLSFGARYFGSFGVAANIWKNERWFFRRLHLGSERLVAGIG